MNTIYHIMYHCKGGTLSIRFHKRRWSPWLGEWLLASQEGVCCMEIVSYISL